MAKKSTKATKSTKKAKTLKQETKQSLIDRIKNYRQERRERKAEAAKRKQTEKAREVRAEKRAIREKALEQVQEAVDKSHRRRSYPGLTLIAVLVIAALGAAAAWQYRQGEVDRLEQSLGSLQQTFDLFEEERQAIEDQKIAEEAQFTPFTALNGEASLEIPAEWEEKPTQLPGREQIIGDDNVVLRIISDETRNTTEDFIPTVDYIWTLNGFEIASRSLHCDRFDTLGNDLSENQREHQDFIVYCDESAERVVVAVLSEPADYAGENGVYFMVEINDIQQFSFEDLEQIITSLQ